MSWNVPISRGTTVIGPALGSELDSNPVKPQ